MTKYRARYRSPDLISDIERDVENARIAAEQANSAMERTDREIDKSEDDINKIKRELEKQENELNKAPEDEKGNIKQLIKQLNVEIHAEEARLKRLQIQLSDEKSKRDNATEELKIRTTALTAEKQLAHESQQAEAKEKQKEASLLLEEQHRKEDIAREIAAAKSKEEEARLKREADAIEFEFRKELEKTRKKEKEEELKLAKSKEKWKKIETAGKVAGGIGSLIVPLFAIIIGYSFLKGWGMASIARARPTPITQQPVPFSSSSTTLSISNWEPLSDDQLKAIKDRIGY